MKGKPHKKRQSLSTLIDEYFREYGGSAKRWLAAVDEARSLTDVIQIAALSVKADGKMDGHQCRIGAKRLRKFGNALTESEVLQSINRALKTRDFDEVYQVLLSEARNHYMVGRLAAYDVADRICVKYRIYPKVVYLHAGVTVGAKNLGIETRGKKHLLPNELPKALRRLAPADVENFLCIYKDRFGDGKLRRTKARC